MGPKQPFRDSWLSDHSTNAFAFYVTSRLKSTTFQSNSQPTFANLAHLLVFGYLSAYSVTTRPTRTLPETLPMPYLADCCTTTSTLNLKFDAYF